MEYLLVAKIFKTVGLKGVVKVSSNTFFQKERFSKGSILYAKKEKEYMPLKIAKSYTDNRFYFLTFEKFETLESAQSLIGLDLFAEKNYKLLKEGEFYFSDLEKMEVFDEQNNLLGKVKKVEEFPAQITLRITSKSGKDFFVPFLEEFIKHVDLKNKKITVKLIEGMYEN